MSRPGWIARAEALALLGVKPQTLYAYVSRGRIAARPDPDDPRRSLYAREDIERLRARAPVVDLSGTPASNRSGELLIESRIGGIVSGRPVYRGVDAIALAQSATLEQALRILIGAEEDPFIDLKPRVDVNFGGGPRVRLFAGLSRRAEEDAASAGRSERSLRREAASVLNEMVDAVTAGGPRLYLHQRLARAWKLDEKDAQVIRAALVLSAEGGLDTPALAARVAASTGAALSAATLSALCAATGSRFCGALAQSIAYLADIRRGGDARAAARQRLSQGMEVPGHETGSFPDGDPRALALIEAARLPEDLLSVVRVGEALTGRPPSFDFALALVGRSLDLPRDGVFTLFALGRAAGWLAHALEVSIEGSPIRARMRYVGPEPDVETPGRSEAAPDPER